ncbi:MAG: hypothetical protein KF855_01260 [Acidobacteria bacterium]|nr:hypothetical protein [Acidobacteriota bacterium]
MRKQQYTFALLFAFLAIPAFCQNRSGDLKFPAQLDISKDIPLHFKRFYDQPGHFDFLTDKFYPIGWSKDGKFAYFEEQADEACGCYFGAFIIQDLKTDKILWEHRHIGDEIGAERDEAVVIGEERKQLWASKNAEFKSKLKQYGIQPAESFSRQTGPIKTEADEIILSIDLTRTDADPLIGFPYNLVRIVGKAVSAKKGEKVIFEEKLKGNDTLYGINGVIDAQIFGHLLSPFESRAAVILVEVVRGYEGPPHTIRTSVRGVSLTSGFKK